MLKESTRKGWAGVLATALAAAGLSLGAAAPAQAAPTGFSLAPVSGTSTNGVLGTYFVMKATATNASNSDDIAFFVEGILSSDISGDVAYIASTDELDADEVVKFDSGSSLSGDVSTMDITQVSTDDKTLSLQTKETWEAGKNVYIGLNVKGSSATSVKITPFFESVTDNGFPNGDEPTGTPVTVSYATPASVAPTTSLSLGAVGTNADTALVKFGDVNMASIVGPSTNGIGTVRFTKNGDATEDVTFDVDTYSSSKGGFEVSNTATSGQVGDLAVGDVLTAAAKVVGAADLSSAGLAQMGDSTVDSMDTNLTFTPQADVISTGATAAKLRAEDGTVTVQADLNNEDGESVEGATVSFKIEETTATSATGATITAAGETLSPSSSSLIESMTVTVAADADGNADLKIDYTDLEDGEIFKVTATVGLNNDSSNSDAEVIFTAEDPTPTKVIDQNRNVGHDEIVVAGTKSYTLWIVDQFGQAWTGSESRMDYSYGGNDFTTTGNTTGIHTFTVTDNNTDAATETLSVETVDVKVSGSFSEDTTPSFSRSVNVVKESKGINRVVITDISDGEKNNTGTTIANSSALVALDEDFNGSGMVTATEANSFDVTVYDSSGAAAIGKTVTVSSDQEVIFSDQTRQAPGSLTYQTDENGKVAVYYDTNSAASHTITVTSGGKSATGTIDFAPVADLSAVKNVAISAPDNVLPGSTLTMTATLTDVWGNPVDLAAQDAASFDVSYSGPGLVVGDEPTETGSDGTAKINVLIGQNDSGSATMTVLVDVDGSTSTVDDRMVVTKSTTIGTSTGTFTGTYGDVYAWTVDQGDGTAKVYVKFPTVGDKVRIGHQTGGSGSYETIYVKTTSSETMDGLRQVAGVGTYVVRTIDLESGTNRIRVDVGDDRLVQVRYNQ